MHININKNTWLREIQLVFSNFYPYLYIEFYRKPHGKYEASPEKDRIDPGTRLGAIRKSPIAGVLQIQPLFKVADVEGEFRKHFGLSVQIFRKDKDGWVQTAGDDDLTLKDLNELGRNSSDDVIVSEYETGFEEPEERPDKLY